MRAVPRVPADIRAEIVRLRGERATYAEIGRRVGVRRETVRRLCEEHFGDLVERARAALRREINLARAEAHTAPPFHPETWG